MKLKLSTAKRPKPQHFHEFFNQKNRQFSQEIKVEFLVNIGQNWKNVWKSKIGQKLRNRTKLKSWTKLEKNREIEENWLKIEKSDKITKMMDKIGQNWKLD